jgi:uncharacterized protein (DUF1015 family)
MATIRPFAALRPEPSLAASICELPYDVMSTEEARQVAAENPLSFLHVSKPEIDLPEETDVYSAGVYAKGKENFQRLIQQGALRQDRQPYFYLYRQAMGQHAQTGLVAVASCQDYLDGVIKKHEFTRPDKEDDRVRHIEALDSQTGPVFLVYRDNPALEKIRQEQMAQPAAIDFTANDGVRHTAWVIAEPVSILAIQEAFAQMSAVYIADGHHRSAAAARVYRDRQGAGESGFFLSVIFPHREMQILPYNRVLKDLNGLTRESLLRRLDQVFERCGTGVAAPNRKHQISFYLDRTWHTLEFRSEVASVGSAFDQLDVSLLQTRVLQPIFGIDDARTSKRINFVGGIRGTAELEKLVNSGDYACAFSMFPTSIEDLMQIANANGVMPPKSTWFEPKLRDAMFCHLL